MTWEEHSAILEAQNCACGAHNTTMQDTNDNNYTIAGPPSTVNVADGANGNASAKETWQAKPCKEVPILA